MYIMPLSALTVFAAWGVPGNVVSINLEPDSVWNVLLKADQVHRWSKFSLHGVVCL